MNSFETTMSNRNDFKDSNEASNALASFGVGTELMIQSSHDNYANLNQKYQKVL